MRLGGWITPAVRNIIIVCTAVFLVQTAADAVQPRRAHTLMLREFGLVPHLVTHGLRLWQPVTYLFLHGGLWHLLFNMLFLWMFGCDIERSWGRRRMYNYFFLTGVGAALINVLVKTIIDPRGLGSATIPTIGASGAIYGILLAAAILFPDRQIWLIPFPVMIPMKIYVLGAGAIEFFSTLGLRPGTTSATSHTWAACWSAICICGAGRGFSARATVSPIGSAIRARRKFEVYMRKHRNEPPSRPDHWVN